MTTTVDLTSFDGTTTATTDVARPERLRDLAGCFDGDGPFAVRGAGLSYALASAAPGGTTISTERLDRFLAHDPEALRVTVQPGVTVGDLLRFAVAHDCTFPVLPGHPSITVGGCAGFNVHGKSQHDVGLFGDHVVSLTLVHPDHGELTCSRTDHPEVFELTLGGMGLTGLITSLTLQLRPLPGRGVHRSVQRVGNLAEAVEVMQERAAGGDGESLYSWNDLNRRGRRFGRGLVFGESYVDDAPPSHVTFRRLAPRTRRRARLNARAAAEIMSLGYQVREQLRPGEVRSVEDAAFPINGNEIYFEVFGRRGFREYQVLVPTDAWPSASAEIERLVAAAGVPITLGSLKLFSGDPRLLWYRTDGVCLAIDAPDGAPTLALLAELDRMAVDHGALVNLSKDSRVGGDTVRVTYPGYDDFRTRLHAFDPARRFDSPLRRRLDV